ncbi:MAG: 2,3-bisphosphoglycerate-independent phosphoglycerate mutase [Candidatus Liptonbacteria bacterium]|nr:2,3-bisphosphoglycerate-independent phosphoglycerate mutase [Candidatus Liptonbacteria bacterium]
MTKKTVILVVLDGWGIGREDESNPIHVANPKSFSWLKENFPMTSLRASGIAIGLPWGEVGNSEVGHLTLGAGKVLYQYYPKIMMAIQDKTFFGNPALKGAFEHAKKNNSAVNLVGLLSKGNVHASLDHVRALLEMATREGVSNVKLHLFADGKDSPPKTVQSFLKEIPQDKLATLVGRYYAMDRNQNWRLTETCYQNMTGGSGTVVADPNPSIEATFKKGLTEEYLPPLRFGEGKTIAENDAVIFFNFREDSMRQLAEAFVVKSFDKFAVKNFQNLHIATMTNYEEKFTVPVAFAADTVERPLGQLLSDAGKNQMRLAETYKYAHITYFFNGYREQPFKNEYRALIPSLSTPRPEEHPEMMAGPITDRLIDAIQELAFDFILVNYSNGDTMAHTSSYDAGLKAVQIIDREMEKLLKVAVSDKIALLVTSDHGNVEEMINPATALPESQHDANPVPFYLVAPEFRGRKFANWKNLANETMGSLADVAPTVLELMGIKKPEEMTGRSLLEGLM